MRKLLWIVLAVLVSAAPVRAERDALAPVRMALNEARLQMQAQSWVAAERVLRSLKTQIFLDPALDAFRTKLEFVLWDLRMGNHDAALKDLDALGVLIAPPASHP